METGKRYYPDVKAMNLDDVKYIILHTQVFWFFDLLCAEETHYFKCGKQITT